MDTQDMNQGQLLEISGNYWKACTLHAAVKLDIFTALAGKQLTSEEISEKLNGDKRGVSMLLNALAAMNLLIKENDKYSNTSGVNLISTFPSPVL